MSTDAADRGGSRRKARVARWVGIAVLAGPVGFAALLALQAVIARSGEQLPRDPGYRVDGVVVPDSAAEAGVRIAVLGDSTVAGVGAPTAEGSLPVLLAERVADRLGRPVEVSAVGVSGARTADVVAAQVPELAGLQPDVVVVAIGSNDVTHLTPPWTLRRQTSELAEAVRAELDAPVVLAGIPRFSGARVMAQPLRGVVDRYARVLRDVQRDAAQEAGIGYVEIARDASPRFVGVPDAMSEDDFHPAPVGYGFWADAIAPAVVALVDR